MNPLTLKALPRCPPSRPPCAVVAKPDQLPRGAPRPCVRARPLHISDVVVSSWRELGAAARRDESFSTVFQLNRMTNVSLFDF